MIKRPTNLFAFLFFILIFVESGHTQGISCQDAEGFCTGSPTTFPAGVNQPDASTTDPGNNYGCLGSEPNPAWYFLQIDQAGSLTINMNNSNNVDIDFILYGPYNNYLDAINNCGQLGVANSAVDCSYSASPTETASFGTVQTGDVYILLITNFSNSPTNINATASGSATTNCNIVNNCNISNVTTNMSACNPGTGTFDLSGSITFTDPPTSGQLIVSTCSGDQVSLNPPFVSPLNYLIPDIIGDSTVLCTAYASFTESPSCNITSQTFTEQMCEDCSIGNIIPFVECNGGVVDFAGTLDFANNIGTGTLVVEITDGVTIWDTIVSPPFTSPVDWSISNTIPSTIFNYTVTAYFSDEATCTSVIVDSINCGCQAYAGTFTYDHFGNSVNQYVLCDGDSIDVNPVGDMICDPGYVDCGVMFGIYTCPPTPNINPQLDPCFSGFASDSITGYNNGGSTGGVLGSIIQAGIPVVNNEVFYVPMTMSDMGNVLYDPSCIDLGMPYQITYLNPITYSETIECDLGSVDVTITGGYSEIFGGNYNITNLLPLTASLSTSTAIHGGSIQITGLNSGDTYSFDIEDATGCLSTFSGGPLTTLSITVSDTSFICFGESAQLTVAGGSSYSWSPSVGVLGANTDTATVSPAINTTYYVNVFDQATGCSGVDSVVVMTENPPNTFINPVPNFCVYDDTYLMQAAEPGGVWSGAGITDAVNGEFDPAVAGSGSWPITYTISVPCNASNTIIVNVDNTPDAQILSSVDSGYAPLDVILINNSTNYSSSVWDVAGDQYTNIDTLPYLFSEVGYYNVSLSVENASGCFDNTSIIIHVKELVDFYVPNVFTPNDDVQNEVFNVYGVGIKTISGKIYNRWGKLIYEWEGSNGWKGQNKNNKDVSEGTYYYIVDLLDTDGIEHQLEGNVLVAR